MKNKTILFISSIFLFIALMCVFPSTANAYAYKKSSTPPYIATINLPIGYKNKPYFGEIAVIDIDGDKVSLKISGLPKGLKVTNCQYVPTFAPGTYYACFITGTPKASGSFTVKAVTKDGTYTVTKYLKLNIQPQVHFIRENIEL